MAQRSSSQSVQHQMHTCAQAKFSHPAQRTASSRRRRTPMHVASAAVACSTPRHANVPRACAVELQGSICAAPSVPRSCLVITLVRVRFPGKKNAGVLRGQFEGPPLRWLHVSAQSPLYQLSIKHGEHAPLCCVPLSAGAPCPPSNDVSGACASSSQV